MAEPPDPLTVDDALEKLRGEWKAARSQRERKRIERDADAVLLIAKVFGLS